MSTDQPIRPGSSDPLQHPGDEAPPGAPQTAENICPQCQGSGKTDGAACENCGGTGRVVVTVGDA